MAAGVHQERQQQETWGPHAHACVYRSAGYSFFCGVLQLGGSPFGGRLSLGGRVVRVAHQPIPLASKTICQELPGTDLSQTV